MISKRFVFRFSLFLLIIGGCTQERSQKKVEVSEPPIVSELVNWTSFNDEGFHNISFPNWFNKDIVQSDSIAKLSLAIYRFQENQNNKMPKDTFPDEIWKFIFDSEGWVKQVTLEEYSQAIQIAEHVFDYKKSPDSLGYSPPTISTKYLFKENQNSIQGIFDQVEDLKVFDRLIFDNMDSISISYKNALSTLSEKHIYITDSSLWNVHFIDEHFQANGSYLYHYGSPRNYSQSFKLIDLVDKTLEQRRYYYGNGIIKIQEQYEGGFYKARSFIYAEDGTCEMFKDSVFSESEEFVNAERSSINHNSFGLPESVHVFAMSDTLNKNQKRKYEFSYLFSSK